jgi:hypothetical protein
MLSATVKNFVNSLQQTVTVENARSCVNSVRQTVTVENARSCVSTAVEWGGRLVNHKYTLTAACVATNLVTYKVFSALTHRLTPSFYGNDSKLKKVMKHTLVATIVALGVHGVNNEFCQRTGLSMSPEKRLALLLGAFAAKLLFSETRFIPRPARNKAQAGQQAAHNYNFSHLRYN